jgi:cystathionine beta-lyase/cystathionine gamma-synthase
MKSFEDICSHSGDEPSRWLGAVSTPIFQTSLFSSREVQGGYAYSRCSNPTVDATERKIAELEGAERALCFSSGMGAISSAILHFVKAGSRVVAHRNIYGPAREFLTKKLARFGVETVFVAAPDTASFAAAMEGGVDLVYLESPSTYLFSLQDIEGISAEAHARGASVAIDNTWSTPLHQRPLSLGVDISLHSASKYLGGHSDIVAGAIACRAELAEAIARGERDLLGSCMDPHQAWLLARGIRTLPLRMERHEANAAEVVAFLRSHELVERVLWPGSSDHPDRDLAQRQMSGY